VGNKTIYVEIGMTKQRGYGEVKSNEANEAWALQLIELEHVEKAPVSMYMVILPTLFSKIHCLAKD